MDDLYQMMQPAAPQRPCCVDCGAPYPCQSCGQHFCCDECAACGGGHTCYCLCPTMREDADAEGISYTAARRLLATATAEVSQDRTAMMAGLVARSRGKFTAEEVADRLERGGQEYAGYLRDGREAAIEALEYALEHGVDAVDDELAAVAVSKGMPITTDDLTEALRRVRDHSLVIDDGSSVAETAYWVADRYWMHRWNNALDRAGIGEYDRVAGPNVYRRFALHEWMAPGHSSGSVPGLY